MSPTDRSRLIGRLGIIYILLCNGTQPFWGSCSYYFSFLCSVFVICIFPYFFLLFTMGLLFSIVLWLLVSPETFWLNLMFINLVFSWKSWHTTYNNQSPAEGFFSEHFGIGFRKWQFNFYLQRDFVFFFPGNNVSHILFINKIIPKDAKN